jgi:hypothetical protein
VRLQTRKRGKPTGQVIPRRRDHTRTPSTAASGCNTTTTCAARTFK